MSRLNRSSSDAVRFADRIAIVFYSENVEGCQYAIATWSSRSEYRLTVCSDGSGLLKFYSSRAKALDAIRRLNKSFNASNVEFISNLDGNITFSFIVDFFRTSSGAA